MRSFPIQPDTHPDEFVPLEIVGGSLDGTVMPIPLPLPERFLNVVRPPRTAEAYRYEERYPTTHRGSAPKVVYVFESRVTLTEDAR